MAQTSPFWVERRRYSQKSQYSSPFLSNKANTSQKPRRRLLLKSHRKKKEKKNWMKLPTLAGREVQKVFIFQLQFLEIERRRWKQMPS